MAPEPKGLSATVKRVTGSGRRVLGLQLWALGLAWLVPRTAHAVSARVCIEVNNTLTGLDDYSPRVGGMGVRDLGEDFGRSDQRLAPPGMLVRVATSVNSTVLWGWGPVDNEGCTALFEAGAGEAIDVETYSWSILDTASVVSLSCVDNVQYDCESQGTIDNAVVPMANGDISIIVPGTRWAYAHYAAAFAESRSRLWDDVTYYTKTGVGVKTIANRDVGGEPTANYGQNTWKRKYTLAHEFGHLQTLVVPLRSFTNADIDFCYNDSDCTLSHAPESQEWQAAAVIEGYADFYSMYTWNDIAGHPGAVMSYDTGSALWKCRYRDDGELGPSDCTENVPNFPVVTDSWMYSGHCMPDSCPAGVAVQADWAFALWDMLGFQPGVSLRGLVEILQFAHPWPTNGSDDDYWVNYTSAALALLTNNELQAWFAIAEIRGIDR